jgi:branched-chain amino acid transport system ATP-binding protein
MATPILKAEGVSKSFGGLQAIKDLAFTIAENEILGIIGPNGAGKTTLINLVTGLLRPDTGTITFGGKDLAGLPGDAVSRMGMARTFQIVRPFSGISALENVVIARLYGSSPCSGVKEAMAESEELLAFVGLETKKTAKAGSLTFAERRKLELARALATKPRLLLLDEVIAGLNPVETENAMATVMRIHASGIAIAFVEHVMKAVVKLSTRVMVLDAGQKIAEGSPQEVMNNPTVIQSYLGGEL